MFSFDSTLKYDTVKNKYKDFAYPQAKILFAKKSLQSKEMIINDINIELTSDFEASICSFKIYNVFDSKTGKLRFDNIKNQVALGTPIEMKLGYIGVLETVFKGFISEIGFIYENNDLPCIEVSAMDIKGVMMSSSYSYQLKSKNYSDAVLEIFRRTSYKKLKGMDIIDNINVTKYYDDDKKSENDITIEMTGESDYEFVVKASKKLNYEFFTRKGDVYFRKAKAQKNPIIELSSGKGIINFDIRYSMNGLVSHIEARSIDVSNGKVIKANSKLKSNLSNKPLSKSIIGDSKKIYIDPSINSKQDAQNRVSSLMEKMKYRFCELNCKCIGIPELLPGNFVSIKGLGYPVDNSFYINRVIHQYDTDFGYNTKIFGKASEVKL